MTEHVESLRDYFTSVFESCNERDNALQHVVVLSYEFDDQQVLNLALRRSLSAAPEARTSDIADLLRIVPVMIYDARKTREHNQLPHFMELLPVRAQPWTCHHAKAYLVVTQRQVHLVLGSMNLTRTGLFANREVFDTFTWSDSGKGEKADLAILREFVEVLARGYASFDSRPLATAIESIRQRLERWGTSEDQESAVLIHQGYEAATGLEALARAWRNAFGDASPERAIAVSPFFDRSAQGAVFAQDLKRTFPSLNALDVVTDAPVAQHLCRDHFRALPRTRLFLIPETLTERERERITQANQPADLAALAISRKLHAKVLVLSRGNEALVYLGSANFTRKAWCGANHEMGVARVHRGSVDKLFGTICNGLSAEQIDRYRDLPSNTQDEMPESEDDYQDQPDYPEFVQSIELVEMPNSELMAFDVRAEPLELAQLADYEVSWGGLPLHFTHGRSNPLDQSQLIGRIIGSRNLKFARRGAPERIYYLPFRHAAALFEQRERYVLSTAEDWMLHYLKERLPLDRDADEFVPGDPGIVDDDPAAAIHAMRERNIVIGMQQHLNLFVRVQESFRSRAAQCLEAPLAEQPSRWRDEVEEPLAAFADILSRDAKGRPQFSTDSLFRLGELVLFARELAAGSSAGHALWTRLKAKLPAHHPVAAVMEYLSFCHENL
ncbi:hypothetical protein WT19_04145 [Burkholderia stagnalis]|uniref:PLD phosphodiesterase domain-containing protein n=1 Tax=Burkholderia stagnalis TaxID=1503054 RepID=A0A6L3MWD7_9BURK|nr:MULTISPECIES: hypothetical protein [Burkholderia]KAB0636922.1 hypothetical protein F7R25_17790 [Burkholderia stagnalis]KVO47480.1 hypothetical protein WT17_06600 [Burkholderia stagnalis]KVO79851.1 hypothetical protein WT19_04145 [Burkholderia stagnalis]KVW55963.1 hypothetical protein WT28_27875 [Burkholderia stagnalis]KVW71767.1 hypothetical protein WT29_31800 [Burkholderia stagnalis]